VTDSVRPYRKEFLRRLAERNRCRTVETMSADVNYVVTAGGLTRIELVEEKVASSKGKEDVSSEIKNLRATLQVMQDGKKIGAQFIAEDEIEAFFLQRQRKAELLRGRTIQPGRASFYVAGETKERSIAQTRMYIQDKGGVIKNDLNDKVDYVVVGAGLKQEFYDEVKRLGIKILREDELPRYFGEK
jgi:NAD-dependent DNA ligase